MDGSGRGTNRLRLLVGAAPWSGLVHPVPEHAERSWRLTRAITGDEVLSLPCNLATSLLRLPDVKRKEDR